MRRKINHRAALTLPFIVAIFSLACGLRAGMFTGDSNNAEPTPTRTPLPTFTPASANVVVIEPIQQENAAPAEAETQTQAQQPVEAAQTEPTATPTLVVQEPTATPTPEVASVTILQNMNIRGGPGTNYPVVGSSAPGEVAKIIGKNDDASWFQIELPSAAGGVGWIYGPLVQIDGPTEAVAVAQAPPPPPTATPPPTDTPAPTAVPTVAYQFTPDGFWGTENAGIVHFKGRIKDEGGNLVNGYSILIDNGAHRIISHPAGPSHHYPEKGPGEWDIVIPDPSVGVGWWWVTVVRYDCPNFAHVFDAQCKQYTKLSEDIKILMNWPDETVLNANWTCHWDCDKGLYNEGYLRNNPGGFHINQ